MCESPIQYHWSLVSQTSIYKELNNVGLHSAVGSVHARQQCSFDFFVLLHNHWHFLLLLTSFTTNNNDSLNWFTTMLILYRFILKSTEIIESLLPMTI
jgi:hypothetical protein